MPMLPTNEIETQLQGLFDGVKLTEGQRQQINDRLGKQLPLLQRATGTPELVPVGSYARGTIVPPGHDVDLLFVWPEAPVEARVALEKLRDLLKAVGYTDLRIQSHSVGIRYAQGPTLDVVPARKEGSDYKIVELKDSNNLTRGGRWIRATPHADAERVKAADRAFDGRASSLIAVLKQQNAAKPPRLKSFHLETLVLKGIEEKAIVVGTPSSMLHAALQYLAETIETDQDPRFADALSTHTRADLSGRYQNDANTFAQALRTGDLALACKVFPAR